MNKKIFTSALILLAILLFTFCFANNDTSLGNEFTQSVNKSENTIQNFGEGVRNVATDIGNGIENAASNVGQGVEDMFNDSRDNNNQGNNNQDNNGGYVATRTTTDGGAGMAGGMMSNSTWIWLILGIVALAIVGLTWYYTTQDNDTRR